MYRCELCDTNRVLDHLIAVCKNCGSSIKIPYDVTEQPMYSRGYGNICFQNSYSRKKRFGNLFDKLLFPTPDKKDEPCLMFLERKVFASFQDLLACLKNSSLPDKRYCSLHTFARLYVQTYEQPLRPRDVFRLKKLVLMDFDAVEFLHRKNMPGKVPFFNYPWLLQKLLTLRGVSQYNPFIKQIKCKKRTAHYEQMFRENCNPPNRDCTNP